MENAGDDKEIFKLCLIDYLLIMMCNRYKDTKYEENIVCRYKNLEKDRNDMQFYRSKTLYHS